MTKATGESNCARSRALAIAERYGYARKTSAMTASPGCKRDLPLSAPARRTATTMTPHDFEARIVEWARQQPDVEALVQIGSRVQAGGEVDGWSDWDYHLIVRSPSLYLNAQWPAQIAPCWCAHYEKTERGVVKLSAIFEGGLEADFVPLAAWQMKLVYWAMARPGLSRLHPSALRRGIATTQLVVGPGYKVILGGSAWEGRLAALSVAWPGRNISQEDFQFHAAAFWRHAVWVQKKCARGESRAALRWQQVELTDHVYALLAEEARLAGRPARPEARKAEQWLDAKRLTQTAMETGIDRRVLARALLVQITLFEEVCRSVAESRSFVLPDYSAVATWLRQELRKLAGPS